MFTGPNIITDGLVLYLDAANTKSYPGSGTTWSDLSGNGNNGTLVNGPTFSSGNNGSIVFDGVNDYFKINNTPDSIRGNVPFSVEGWFIRTGNFSQRATWGFGGDISLGGVNSWNYDGTNEITIDLWGTSTYSTLQTYSSTEWKHIVWVYLGGTFTKDNIIIYIDNIPYTGLNLITRRGGSGVPNINNNGVVIGRAGGNSDLYYSSITVSNFKIYNRVLTPQEVLQNYKATKSRFNL